MYKIVVQIEAEGDKKSIYGLKETLLRNAAQQSCKCQLTITSNEGFQEMTSASFSPIVEVSSDDIVDLSLTGEEQYELLIHKEKEGKTE